MNIKVPSVLKTIFDFSVVRGWIILLIIITIPTLFPLFNPGFFSTQDYIYIGRLYQMNEALRDGQFPVRWVPDFRYGEPLYNFYAPLPYYAGVPIKNLGFSYIQSIKILFALGFILSGITMFYLAKELFGKLGGFLSAVLYVYAPYHSVDVYVRGALSESWALIFFPLIFLFVYRLISQDSKDKQQLFKNILLLAFSLTGLFYTHNIMTILFSPFIAGWAVFLIGLKKNIRIIPYLAIAGIIGFGLAASFLLPAFFEKNLVQSDRLITGYFDFRAHYVTISQFFVPNWGYGASLWGPVDDMSFQIGIAHWIIFAIALLVSLRFKEYRLIILALVLGFLFSLFMQHNRSAPIWEKLYLLAFTQFPWRFLGISIFFISLVGGIIALLFPKRAGLVIIGISLLVVMYNVQFFRPDIYYYDSIDSHYISDENLAIDNKLPKDYLPIWVKKIEDEKRTYPQVNAGSAHVKKFEKNSLSAFLEMEASQSSEIEIPITYFPGWVGTINGEDLLIKEPSEFGLIRFDVPVGKHTVLFELQDTLVRKIGNLLSFGTITGIALLLLNKKIRKILL